MSITSQTEQTFAKGDKVVRILAPAKVYTIAGERDGQLRLEDEFGVIVGAAFSNDLVLA